MLIVVLLGDGPKRFNEIKGMIGGISQRTLKPAPEVVDPGFQDQLMDKLFELTGIRLS